MNGNALHVRIRISPQNSGTITDTSGTPLHVAPDGTCWSNGQQIGTQENPARAAQAVTLSDGHTYVQGMKSGEWFQFVGGEAPWRVPTADALNYLRSL